MDQSSLVAQIKEIQRSSPESKQAWWNYADTNLGGVRDPNKHDVNTLNMFLSAYNSGSLQGMGAGGCTAGKGGGKGGKGNMLNMMMQAMGMGGGGGFGGGCGGFGGGCGGGGAGFGGGGSFGGGAGDDMTEFIKSGQRSSPAFKVAWQTYCTAHGTGKFDPKNYGRDFIGGFAEYIGGLAATDMGAEVPASGQKRPMPFEGGASKRMNTGATMQLDPEKADLVNRVKNVQKTMAGGRDAWGTFCDTNTGGVRDPAKNDNATLQSFLLQMGA